MRGVSINLDFLARTYFYFDEPVDYKLDNGYILKIYPISIRDSEIFLSSVGLFTIDKNSLPDASIISMSYLQFIVDVLMKDKVIYQQFINLLSLCLDMKDPRLLRNQVGKPILAEGEGKYFINGAQFEDIRRIVLYQNIPHFDDSYVNPELKKAISEVNELKNKGIEQPTTERKIAIVSSHTGITKKEQLYMTYRSHQLLFEEVCGEVEFATTRPIVLFNGKGNELDHWIFKKKKNKFDDYVTRVEEYTKSMGSDSNAIHVASNSNIGEEYFNMFNKFNK